MSKTNRSSRVGDNDVNWSDNRWMDTIHKDRYGPAEKRSNRIMIPVNAIWQIIKRWRRKI